MVIQSKRNRLWKWSAVKHMRLQSKVKIYRCYHGQVVTENEWRKQFSSSVWTAANPSVLLREVTWDWPTEPPSRVSGEVEKEQDFKMYIQSTHFVPCTCIHVWKIHKYLYLYYILSLFHVHSSLVYNKAALLMCVLSIRQHT